MASGQAHTRASLLAVLPAGIAAGLILGPWAVPGAMLGCNAGVLLTPDLDQIGISKGEWTLVRKLGPLGFLWMAFWSVYAKALRHRGFWSHCPVVGTIGRLGYCGVLISLIWIILGRPEIPPLTPEMQEFLWGAGLGLLISDTIHFIMDGCCLRNGFLTHRRGGDG